MLFNSYVFIFLYLPVTLFLYYLFAKKKLTKIATWSLIIQSFVFYSYWDIHYLALLLVSICTNYTLGSLIEKYKSKCILAFGIIFNLSLLGYYKYAGFFVENLNQLFQLNSPVPEIILPLGISFFTFTQTAYLVDAYRGETERYSVSTYLLFVTFFPHLIAGPILYHKDIIPQFNNLRNFVFNYRNLSVGILLFGLGLFKKVIIADNLAPWATIVFDNASKASFLEAWVGALAYTLQLYFDFSGYSEMAVGLGLMCNIRLPINFNSPYQSTSIIDFWIRWHITLSEFLKNYLYIPLGGNREGELTRYRNLFITMLLGGLWHGANWTFVAWGALHGFYLVLNHYWRRLGGSLPLWLAWPLTFISIVIAWVFFRAKTLYDGVEILKSMAGLKSIIFPVKYSFLKTLFVGTSVKFSLFPVLPIGNTELITLLALIIALQYTPNPHKLITNFQPNWRWAIIAITALSISILNLNKVSDFLYFQF